VRRTCRALPTDGGHRTTLEDGEYPIAYAGPARAAGHALPERVRPSSGYALAGRIRAQRVGPGRQQIGREVDVREAPVDPLGSPIRALIDACGARKYAKAMIRNARPDITTDEVERRVRVR
jgi:hypothetical protein